MFNTFFHHPVMLAVMVGTVLVPASGVARDREISVSG